MLGLGIGLVLGAICIASYPRATMSQVQIEKMARDMGMKYPDEIRAFFQNDKDIKGGKKSD